jgi:drug/metabolite transporter (DMT)-like permease
MTTNLRGMILMVAAMATFAVEDALIKAATVTLPPGQVLILLSCVGLPFLAIWSRIAGHDWFDARAFRPLPLLRMGCEMAGTLGFVMALSLIPISTATAILQLAPLMVVAGAALFLRQTVGWRRWLAVLVGFLGVMLILRPTADAFDPAALWALLGVLGMAGRDLATRAIGPGLPTPVMAMWGYASVILLGACMLAVTGGAQWPEPGPLAMVGTAGLIGCIAYWAIIEATRAGDVAAIMPLRYSRLVFGVLIGVIVFGERPDGLALIGMALVVGAGLYALARERALSKAPPPR